MSETDLFTRSVLQILDRVEITLVKSIIEVHYSLNYERQFNAGSFESTLYASANGRPFSSQTNPCVDAASSTGACGWTVDANGNRIPFSNVSSFVLFSDPSPALHSPSVVYGAHILQGFCCSCALSTALTRSQLTCNALGSLGESAHCLNLGPLWYAVRKRLAMN